MKKIYYVNNSGKKLDLMSERFDLQTGTLFDHDNECTVSGRQLLGISGTLTEKEILLTIQGDGEVSLEEAMDMFNEYTEPDVQNKTPGRLYCGDSYIQCYLKGAELLEWEYDAGYIDKNVKLITAYPCWITEKTVSFYKSGGEPSGDYLDYAMDYPKDYTAKLEGIGHLLNDHYLPCDFKMVVFGPCINPHININGHPYEVFTVLEEGEYLTISSKSGEIIRTRINGTEVNEYNNRQKYPSPSIFDKISIGQNLVSWDGNFGFDITLLQEGSEPIWK